MRISALIPIRFLAILFHLILLIIMIQSRADNIKAGLTLDHSEKEYEERDRLFFGGLIAGITLTSFELLCFFSGLSMFATFQSFISVLCHSSASMFLSHLVMQELDSQYYWLIFVFCSIIPSFLEGGNLLLVILFQKGS